MVQELELDQVLTLFTCTDTWRTHVRTRKRPGTQTTITTLIDKDLFITIHRKYIAKHLKFKNT